jgi:septum formation protein
MSLRHSWHQRCIVVILMVFTVATLKLNFAAFAFSSTRLCRRRTFYQNLAISGRCIPSLRTLHMSSAFESDTARESLLTDDSQRQNPRLVLSWRDALRTDRLRLVLASQSPRRREILDMMGLSGLYDVIPSPLNETALQQELLGSASSSKTQRCCPKEYTQRLAQEKALALANDVHLLPLTSSTTSSPTTVIVLGSDTIVDYQDSILEKPRNEQEAFQMLSRLSGQQHAVHTGVAVVVVRMIKPDNEPNNNDADTAYQSKEASQWKRSVTLVASFTDTATVTLATLSKSDIHAYIATGEPMDKAGSYGIQGIGGQMIQRVEGDFFTVSLFECLCVFLCTRIHKYTSCSFCTNF